MRDLASSKEWYEMYGTPIKRHGNRDSTTQFSKDVTEIVENTYDKLNYQERVTFDKLCASLVNTVKAKSPRSQFSLDMARETLGKIGMAEALIANREEPWW